MCSMPMRPHDELKLPEFPPLDVSYTLRVVECLLRSESRPHERDNLLRLLEGWQSDDSISDWCKYRARSLVREFAH